MRLWTSLHATACWVVLSDSSHFTHVPPVLNFFLCPPLSRRPTRDHSSSHRPSGDPTKLDDRGGTKRTVICWDPPAKTACSSNDDTGELHGAMRDLQRRHQHKLKTRVSPNSIAPSTSTGRIMSQHYTPLMSRVMCVPPPLTEAATLNEEMNHNRSPRTTTAVPMNYADLSTERGLNP
jgi:hypothetical protein